MKFNLIIKLNGYGEGNSEFYRMILEKTIPQTISYIQEMFPSVVRIDNETTENLLEKLVVGVVFGNGEQSFHEVTIDIDDREFNKAKLVNTHHLSELINSYIFMGDVHGISGNVMLYRRLAIKLEQI